jgi:hypothetical protein
MLSRLCHPISCCNTIFHRGAMTVNNLRRLILRLMRRFQDSFCYSMNDLFCISNTANISHSQLLCHVYNISGYICFLENPNHEYAHEGTLFGLALRKIFSELHHFYKLTKETLLHIFNASLLTSWLRARLSWFCNCTLALCTWMSSSIVGNALPGCFIATGLEPNMRRVLMTTTPFPQQLSPLRPPSPLDPSTYILHLLITHT